MARKYAVRDFIIGDISYHDTVDDALTRAIAVVSSSYASLGFDYMDGASCSGGSPWMTGPMEIWGMYNGRGADLVVLAIVDELGRLPDIPSFAEELSPDPQQWVSKLAASCDEWRAAA